MDNLQRTVAVITAECLPNATIEEVAYSMCDLAAQTSCYVKFVYEGVEMLVSFHHTDAEIVKEWRMRKEPINRVI
jgi:hypothetical protein